MDPTSMMSFLVVILASLIPVILALPLARYETKRLVEPSPRAIPTAIQDEIDQTPEWWDREFRKLSGEPESRQWGIQTADALSAIEKMYSPRAWSDEPRYWVGSDLFIGGPGPSTKGFFNLYCPKEGDSYRVVPSRPERITKFLTKYGLVPLSKIEKHFFG